MKYLVKNQMIMTDENWLERMGDISIEQFAKDNGFEIFDKKPQQFVLEDNKKILEKELKEIRIWFEENDYIPNKIITGEWEETDERWITYLADRKVYRHRQDEINALLGE